MGIFGSSQAGQARYSGELHNLQITQSVFGTTVPIIIGTRRVAAKLLFYGGFTAVPAPSAGKGIGAGKGAQQFEYYADVIAALASGSATAGCAGLLNVWDQQGKLENLSSSTNYTIPSGSGGRATATATVGAPPGESGPVAAISMTYGGTGYSSSSPPNVYITGNGNGATAHATVSAGSVTVVLDTGGAGYSSTPGAVTVTIDAPPGGGGSVTPLSTPGSPAVVNDLGVAKSVSYSVGPFTDYGSGGARTLSGIQLVPLQKVTGTPLAGQYNFNPSTSTYTFSPADAGDTVSISYSSVFSLYYFESTQPAEVPLSGPYQISTTNQSYFWQDNGVVRADTGAALVSGSDYTESAGVYTFASYLAGVAVYINYTYTSSDANLTNTSSLNLTFFNGALGQAPWSYMTSKYPGSAFGYTGICYVGANPMTLGETATIPQFNYEVMGIDLFPGGGLDAHPCDAFRTLLFDAFLGVGFPSSNVDPWISAYAYWAANGYLISKTIDTQTSVSDAMSEVIEAGNVAAVWSGGLLKLIPYGDATCVGNGGVYIPPGPVATLTWDDLLPASDARTGQRSNEDPLQISQRAPQDCSNYAQAQWCNRLNDYNNELINEQNDAFIQQYGRRIESPQNWDWITTNAAATWALRLRLNRLCYLRNTYKFWLPFWFTALEPMDLIVLPSGETVRITSIEDNEEGRLAIEAEQWTYGSTNVTLYPKQSSSSFQPTISQALPGDAVPIFIQQTLDSSAGLQNQLQIGAVGMNPNWGGANVYVSLDGASYAGIGSVTNPATMGILSASLPSSVDPDTTDTLSVDLTLSGSSAELVTVTQAQADVSTSLCAIVDPGGLTNELISYETATLTAAGRYNLTYLRRGRDGTAIGAHPAGAWFAFLGPSYSFLSFQSRLNYIGGFFYVKLQSFNLLGKQLQNASQVAVWQIPITLQGSAIWLTWITSNYSTSFVGTAGTVTNPTAAFDGSLATAATITSAGTTGSPPFVSQTLTLFGFVSVTLSQTVTLCVSFLIPGTLGGQITMTYSTGGPSTQFYSGGSAPGKAVGGIATAALPAGTDLSTLSVSITAGTTAIHDAVVEVFEVWIQPPGGKIQ